MHLYYAVLLILVCLMVFIMESKYSFDTLERKLFGRIELCFFTAMVILPIFSMKLSVIAMAVLLVGSWPLLLLCKKFHKPAAYLYLDEVKKNFKPFPKEVYTKAKDIIKKFKQAGPPVSDEKILTWEVIHHITSDLKVCEDKGLYKDNRLTKKGELVYRLCDEAYLRLTEAGYYNKENKKEQYLAFEEKIKTLG